MKVIEIINKDGSMEIFDNKKKMTKTAILFAVKKALESEDTKEIRIK